MIAAKSKKAVGHEYVMFSETNETLLAFCVSSLQLCMKFPPARSANNKLSAYLLPKTPRNLIPVHLSALTLLCSSTLPGKHLRACTPTLVFLLKAIINHLPFVSRLSAYFANVFSLHDPGFRVERGLL